MFIDNAIQIETDEILAHISRLKAESEGGGADLPVLTELRDVLIQPRSVIWESIRAAVAVKGIA
jgi:hypothetical protein